MFALYLDLQKQLDIDDMSREEAKGRWKSFVKKWYSTDPLRASNVTSNLFANIAGIVEN